MKNNTVLVESRKKKLNEDRVVDETKTCRKNFDEKWSKSIKILD